VLTSADLCHPILSQVPFTRGEDPRALPLLDRRRALREHVQPAPRLQLIEHVETHGEALFHAIPRARLRRGRGQARRRALSRRPAARVGEDQEPRLLAARRGGVARTL